MSDGFVFLGDETIDAFMGDQESHVKFLGGPIGTGKSVGCLFELARFCLRVVPENDDGTPGKAKALVIRQDQSKIKSTVLQTFRELFGKVSDDLTKMAYPIVVENLPFKGEVDGVERTVHITWIFLGVASLDEANTKLRSFEATCAYINETQTYEGAWIVNETFNRLGRYPLPKRDANGDVLDTGYQGQRVIVADYNPPADDHWLYKADKEGARPDTWRFYKYPSPLLYIKDVDGNIVDFEPNPEAKDYAKKQSSGYNYWLAPARALIKQPGGLRKIAIDIMGGYGNSYAGKPVYEEWDDDLHIAKTKLVANKSKPFYVGFDHSGVNPAMVIAQMGDGGLAILHEMYAGEMTVEDFLDEVFVPLINEYGYDRKNMTIILDPHDARDRSGQTTKRMLLKKQFRAVHSNTNDPVKRQGAVKHYLTRRLMKVDKSCKMLIEGFRGKYNREKIRGTEHYKAVPDANKNEWSHCFIGETLITMGDGSKKQIADVNAGDYVLTPNGEKRVLAKMFRDYAEDLLTVITNNGTIVTCTPEHHFYTPKGFFPIDAIQYNDSILELSCGKLSTEEFLQNTKEAAILKATQKLMESAENFTRSNMFGGLIMAGKYQTIKYMFTIKMATLQTMIFQTWKKSSKYFIAGSMLKNERQSKSKKVLSTWSELDQKPQNGINQKKVGLGTLNTQKMSQKLSNLNTELKTHAAYVKLFIWYLPHKLKSLFVHQHVNHKQEDCQELTWRTSNVTNAQKYTKEVNTTKASFAQDNALAQVGIKSKTKFKPKNIVKVYDLTVEDEHVYFANGILVHNCQDATQYLISFLKYGAGLDRDVATNRQIQEGGRRGFGGVMM